MNSYRIMVNYLQESFSYMRYSYVTLQIIKTGNCKYLIVCVSWLFSNPVTFLYKYFHDIRSGETMKILIIIHEIYNMELW